MTDNKEEKLSPESMAAQLFSDELQRKVYLASLTVLQKPVDGKGPPLKEIIPKIIEKVDESVNDSFVYGVLNEANKSDLSPIRSGGPWRGYYLDQGKVDQRTNIDSDEVEAEILVGKTKLAEKHLYPLVALWMKTKKKCVHVSDNVHGLRRGGIWSNPDVVALNPIDRLGFFDIEAISAEIKLSDQQWQKWVFEAVAHRRYVDRSYFIFRAKDGVVGMDAEILVYAEKFRVGIAVIDLPDEKVTSVVNWKNLSETDRLEFVDAIVEVVPAPSENVSVREKCEFLENINIRQKDELYKFGTVR